MDWYIFLLPSSRASYSFCASRKVSRLLRLAHKAPVMQGRTESEGVYLWKKIIGYNFGIVDGAESKFGTNKKLITLTF